MVTSLLLIPDKYKASKLYSQLPESGAGDFTFTRSGDSATRINSAGVRVVMAANIPRIDYSSGGCPSLLLEPERTNLFLNSAVLVSQEVELDTATYTLSFYGNGSVTNQQNGVTTDGTGANNRVVLVFAATAALITFTVGGSVTSAQLTLGTNVTSFIPTLGSPVTRGADILTLSAATALIGQTEGTVFVDVIYDAAAENIAAGLDQPIMVIGTNIDNFNAVLLYGSPTNKVAGRTINGGVLQSFILNPSTQPSGVVKIAYTYAANSFKLFVNGVKINQDLTGTIPAAPNIFFGAITQRARCL